MTAYDFARYLNIRSAYGSSFAPDGDRVAFITNITGVPQVWQVAASGGWPNQLTFFSDRVSFIEYAPARGPRAAGHGRGRQRAHPSSIC